MKLIVPKKGDLESAYLAQGLKGVTTVIDLAPQIFAIKSGRAQRPFGGLRTGGAGLKGKPQDLFENLRGEVTGAIERVIRSSEPSGGSDPISFASWPKRGPV